MDSVSMNQYEKQLYSVFKTFDINNDEALDKFAVKALCDALQLEERGETLADALFTERSGRVTFTQFRNGLLAVLGDSESQSVSSGSAATKTSSTQLLSDDDSSGREVAPKFVFGSKKYGRRSRPRCVSDAQDESQSPRASSASRLETEEKKAGRKMRYRRSASLMDAREDDSVTKVEEKNSTVMPCDFDHDRRIGREEALALCQGLHLDAVDSHLIDSIFAETTAAETTVGDFFEKLNISLTSSIEEVSNVSGIPSHEDKNDAEHNEVAMELVLEALDSAGVPQSRRLLLELGFATEIVHPPDIQRALEDELQALAQPTEERHNARAFLFKAALAIGRLRLDLARQKAELIVAERDKLRNDLLEANKRAGILAQEVDESHARIENELKVNLKRMEARHAEATRIATAEYTAEREKAAQQQAHLEAVIARKTEVESKLRTEINCLRVRIEDAENRASAAEERVCHIEEEQKQLIVELQAERERSGEVAENGRGATGELATKVDELRAENKALRDRNDELCAELEALGRQIQNACDESHNKPMSQEGDLSNELKSIFHQGHSEESDSCPVSMDQKVLGHVEATNILREIFDSIQAIPSPEGHCGCADTIAIIKEKISDISEAILVPSPPLYAASLPKDAGIQTDDSMATSPTDVEQLKIQLVDAQKRHDEEQQKLTNLINDLEISLEQMKFEYEKCEEYWSNKMEEERAAFNEEQRMGDERLAQLVAKIGDYERQFAKRPLPTIDEKYGLEAQVNDLQDEFNKYKKEKEAELAEKEKEIARIKSAAEARERRPQPAHPKQSGAGAGCACGGLRMTFGPTGVGVGAEVRELRARTARAEAAARRLHARLAAADLLVKDLYVENCHLAHRRHI